MVELPLMTKQAIGYRGGKLPRKARAAIMEAMRGVNVIDIGEKMQKSLPAITRQTGRIEAKSIAGVRETQRRRELDEFLEILREITRKPAETKLKYADIISAGKLKAEIEGFLRSHSEENHLHIHGELTGMSEAQLRAELNKIEHDKAITIESSSVASGTPHDGEGVVG